MSNKFLLIAILFFSIFSYSQTSEQDCETARKQYLIQNPDVAKAGMNAWSHYISYGKREGRKWPACNNFSSESIAKDDKIVYDLNITKRTDSEFDKEFIFNNGDKYIGEYNDEGIINGNGTYIFKNGNKYIGELKMGAFEGKGKLIYNNGDIYDGNWLNDKKEGLGKYTYSNGDIYEGNFKSGYMMGKGKLSISNGNIYIGEFVKNKMSGNGKYYYENGAIYEGQFQDDKFNGQGILSYNGDIYKGNFKHSIFDGYGRFTFSNGAIYEGNWLDNKMSGYGKYTLSSGEIYEGNFNQGYLDGVGKYSYNNGDVYVGNYKNNMKEGEGQYFYNNGNVYKGNFKNDLFDGYGKLLRKDGTFKEGIWEKDILVNDYNKVKTSPLVQSSNNSNSQTSGNVFEIYQNEMEKVLKDNPTMFGGYSANLSTSGTNINGEKCKKCKIVLRTPKKRACYICNKNFSGWGFVKKDYGITSEHEELQSPCFPISGIHNYKGWKIQANACCSRKCANKL